jgi:hypothetical protein
MDQEGPPDVTLNCKLSSGFEFGWRVHAWFSNVGAVTTINRFRWFYPLDNEISGACNMAPIKNLNYRRMCNDGRFDFSKLGSVSLASDKKVFISSDRLIIGTSCVTKNLNPLALGDI